MHVSYVVHVSLDADGRRGTIDASGENAYHADECAIWVIPRGAATRWGKPLEASTESEAWLETARFENVEAMVEARHEHAHEKPSTLQAVP